LAFADGFVTIAGGCIGIVLISALMRRTRIYFDAPPGTSDPCVRRKHSLDENKPIRGSYFGGPTFYNLILVGRAAWHGRRHGLVKEGHRKVAKVAQPRFDSFAFLEVFKNPPRGFSENRP